MRSLNVLHLYGLKLQALPDSLQVHEDNNVKAPNRKLFAALYFTLTLVNCRAKPVTLIRVPAKLVTSNRWKICRFERIEQPGEAVEVGF